MGAEEFTLGKPHVAIDPTLRIQRFIKESRDPETAVILLDMLLGYALCEDPAGHMEQPIRNAMAAAKAEGRRLCVITSLCGSDLDPQGLAAQEKILKDAGALVMQNNGGSIPPGRAGNRISKGGAVPCVRTAFSTRPSRRSTSARSCWATR